MTAYFATIYFVFSYQEVVNVESKEYELVDISHVGELVVMMETGELRQQSFSCDDEELLDKIKMEFDQGENLSIRVLQMMGKEKVVDFRKN